MKNMLASACPHRKDIREAKNERFKGMLVTYYRMTTELFQKALKCEASEHEHE